MRIAIINWNRRKIAGSETYLNSVIPELHRCGHTIAFLHERDDPPERERIALPDISPSWCIADLGCRRAITALRKWNPDLIYAHGLLDPKLEMETIGIAPSVFFAHNYYGSCISGAKTHKYPVVRPCTRRFGWQCLLHFYPHRCGGLNPITMWEQYRLQSSRLEVLRKYDAILVFSEHMRSEFVRHGLTPYLAYNLSSEAPSSGNGPGASSDAERRIVTPVLETDVADTSRDAETKPFWQLVFLGRMEFIKGGHVFIDALSQLAGSFNRPMRVIFAGDGPDRAVWQRKAEQVQRRCRGLTIEFRGWLNKVEIDRLLADCDLLVLPSLWPEPFGLAVTEAGRRGVPVAAFAVGGIPCWLTDGVNGHLAPGDPPTATGLADAIRKCFSDPVSYSRLRDGALRVGARFRIEFHVAVLQEIFEKVARQGTKSN